MWTRAAKDIETMSPFLKCCLEIDIGASFGGVGRRMLLFGLGPGLALGLWL